MLPLLKSLEQETASLDRKVILVTPGKREEGPTFASVPGAGKSMLAGMEQNLFPAPEL